MRSTRVSRECGEIGVTNKTLGFKTGVLVCTVYPTVFWWLYGRRPSGKYGFGGPAATATAPPLPCMNRMKSTPYFETESIIQLRLSCSPAIDIDFQAAATCGSEAKSSIICVELHLSSCLAGSSQNQEERAGLEEKCMNGLAILALPNVLKGLAWSPSSSFLSFRKNYLFITALSPFDWEYPQIYSIMALLKGRPSCSQAIYSFLLFLFGFFGVLIWYGMNSDKDNIPQVLTQLIPAGHCTCQTSTNFECDTCLDYHFPNSTQDQSSFWQFQYGRDENDLGLDEDQCDASFPGLFEDISRATKHWRNDGNVSLATLDGISLRQGMARVAIVKGELYIIAVNSKEEDHRRKILATLHSICRARSSSRSRTGLPDIEFIFSVEDKIADVARSADPIFALARKASEQAFLMPDFGLWAWENIQNGIGPYSEVVDTIIRRERNELSWSSKRNQLVWRGKLSFAPKLRRALVDVTRNKDWADIKPLEWNRKDHFLSMEDHCRYTFIAHVEGTHHHHL